MALNDIDFYLKVRMNDIHSYLRHILSATGETEKSLNHRITVMEGLEKS